jgi:hypothetical protein
MHGPGKLKIRRFVIGAGAMPEICAMGCMGVW